MTPFQTCWASGVSWSRLFSSVCAGDTNALPLPKVMGQGLVVMSNPPRIHGSLWPKKASYRAQQ